MTSLEEAEIRRILQAEVEREKRLLEKYYHIRPEVKIKGSKKRPVIDLPTCDYEVLLPPVQT